MTVNLSPKQIVELNTKSQGKSIDEQLIIWAKGGAIPQDLFKYAWESNNYLSLNHYTDWNLLEKRVIGKRVIRYQLLLKIGSSHHLAEKVERDNGSTEYVCKEIMEHTVNKMFKEYRERYANRELDWHEVNNKDFRKKVIENIIEKNIPYVKIQEFVCNSIYESSYMF